MPDTPPLLSALLAEHSSRRSFLTRASALSLAHDSSSATAATSQASVAPFRR